jgi:hypothetical protein
LLDARERIAGPLDAEQGVGRGHDPAVLAADGTVEALILVAPGVVLHDRAQVFDAVGPFAGLRIGLEVVRVNQRVEGGRFTAIHGAEECLEDLARLRRGHGDLLQLAGGAIGSTHSARHSGGSHESEK